MRVVVLQRWLDVLASLLVACREAWRVRRSLIVSRQAGHFVVRKAEPHRDAIVRPGERDNDMIAATVAAGAQAPAAVLRTARNGFVIFELPSDEVAVRRLSVPSQAREFLPGIVRNQIERLSPWQFDQASYGFDATPNADDAANLEVRVSIVPRSAVDAARSDLAAIGLDVDRIATRPGDTAEGGSVTLWSRLSEGTREDAARAGRRIGIAIAATVVVSFGLSAWALMSAQSIRAESDSMENRAKTLQRQIAGQRTPQALASLNPQERMWHARETSPAAVIVLEALSRALPDAAHVTELRLEGATLRVIGQTKDAPSLIAPLEQSGHLADVRFSAPTTRDADGVSFRFQIEARVQPRLAVAENRQ